jgi:hypothetical protein
MGVGLMALVTRGELRQKASTKITKSFSLNENLQASTILKNEASAFSKEKTYDIFLSHSSLDAKEILGLKLLIEELGYSVYVDWIEDKQLDRTNVTKETAAILKERMQNCKCLFFATSNNSPNSVWMPWELGYFDGIKSMVAIFPILDSTAYGDSYEGQEYLGLYPYISLTPTKLSDKRVLWVNESANTYVLFDKWLKGEKPTKHN